jgi:hypothetical protein
MAVRVVEFSNGGYKIKIFFHKNPHTQRKLLNFEFFINGELSKSAKIWLSKPIFYVKNHLNLSQSFFIEEYQFRSTFFDKINFEITLFVWYPIFDSLPLIQNSIISFGFVDSYAEIFLISYPPLENSTTCIAIPHSTF